MTASRLLRLAVPLALVVLVTGCASSAPATSDPVVSAPAQGGTESAAGSASDDPPADAAADAWGCTDETLAYLADNGYADVPPADPSTFTFPTGIGITAVPTCYVEEDDGVGASRASAVFADDPTGAFDQAVAAFAAAGWQGTVTEMSGGIWWSDGADVTEAKYSVGGGKLDMNGQPVAWFTWGY